MRVKDYGTRPSFLRGMARVLDLGGTLDEYDVEGFASADEITVYELARDAEAIASDLQRAYTKVRAGLPVVSTSVGA